MSTDFDLFGGRTGRFRIEMRTKGGTDLGACATDDAATARAVYDRFVVQYGYTCRLYLGDAECDAEHWLAEVSPSRPFGVLFHHPEYGWVNTGGRYVTCAEAIAAAVRVPDTLEHVSVVEHFTHPDWGTAVDTQVSLSRVDGVWRNRAGASDGRNSPDR